jgi:hypothetical protein
MTQNPMDEFARSQAALIDGEVQSLRRTFTPYMGQTTIFSAVTLFLTVVGYKSGEMSFLWGVPLIWTLYGLLVLIGLRYRVAYDETWVIMRASGGADRRIRFVEIAEVKYEIGASKSRPFRRLVILGRRDVQDALIDVSLRHFQLDDIQKLLSKIHEHRPDLALPPMPSN